MCCRCRVCFIPGCVGITTAEKLERISRGSPPSFPPPFFPRLPLLHHPRSAHSLLYFTFLLLNLTRSGEAPQAPHNAQRQILLVPVMSKFRGFASLHGSRRVVAPGWLSVRRQAGVPSTVICASVCVHDCPLVYLRNTHHITSHRGKRRRP